jgi:putative ABC transport system ATP-binding protein
MKLLLDVRNITSHVSKENSAVLNHIDLTLNSKDRLVVRGPSGSGKSLLLRSITFLDPIASGEVWFQGKRIQPGDIPAFRSEVIYLSQKPSLIEGTVADNLKYVLSFRVNETKIMPKEKVSETLSQFNLSENFLNQSAKHLSGGEAQIVALVRALLMDPKVMLLDEPTASLDRTRSDLFEKKMIQWIEGSSERAFIWITHQQEQESRVGKSFLTLKDGRLNFCCETR